MKRNIRVNAIDLRFRRPDSPRRRRLETELRVGFIVDFRCPEVLPLLKSEPDFFESHQIYALFSNASFDILMPLLQMQNGVRLDCDISVFTANGRIFDLYKIDNARNEDSRIMVEENGSWNASAISLGFNSAHFKIQQRKNLMNVTLDAVLYVSYSNDNNYMQCDRDLSPSPDESQIISTWRPMDNLPERTFGHNARFHPLPPAVARNAQEEVQLLRSPAQNGHLECFIKFGQCYW